MFSIDWHDETVELSHVYKMAKYFFDLNRGYEVCLCKWIMINGQKKLIQGKASHNDPKVACELAYQNLVQREFTAPEDHAKHMAQVSKLKSSRPPEPPKPSMATLTLDDLDL